VPVGWRASIASIAAIAAAAVALCALAAPRPAAAAASGPAPVVTPALTGGAFGNGEVVSISVGPNSTFVPNSRIVILECAAPGGVPPINDDACDGNTVQYGSLLVAADGSFEEHAYRIYQLPDHQLSETPGSLPDCNASAECILYIGQDQNDFTQPKVFSEPFLVDASAAPAPVGQPTTLGSGAPAAAPARAAGGTAAALSPAATPASGGSAASPTSPSGTGSSHSPTTHGDAAAPASEGGLVASGHGPLFWLLVVAIVLILLALAALGGVHLRRKVSP
jgi:hypothetical protein